MPTLVHLIYIHGFQGNDTTFQSFPKHLQEHLEASIPRNLDMKIQSSLYPTYKSVRPISYATKNFLEWLSTQPPGPVILLGHSMGGLLAADAATDPSNNPDKHRPKRIVGVIAFDTPYLGMHPHVVISGIASLLPKGDAADAKKKGKSEEVMNQHPQVNVVDEKVTDDWDSFKKEANIHPKHAPYSSDSQSATTRSTTSITTTLSVISKASSALTASNANPCSPSPSSSSHHHTKHFVERALAVFAAEDDDAKFIKWLRKHADEPFSAGTRWVVEHFQFGICMFDPAGLKSRYSRLVDWEAEGGLWVNYWTTTIPRSHHHRHDPAHGSHEHNEHVFDASQSSIEHMDNDEALLANGILSANDTNSFEHNPSGLAKDHAVPSGTTPLGVEQANGMQKAIEDEAQKAKQNGKPAKDGGKKSKDLRHFVVLPNGLGNVLGGMDKWENVPIAGVEDEVNAHTGLFIPTQNLGYDALVQKVANRILGWCERIVTQGDAR